MKLKSAFDDNFLYDCVVNKIECDKDFSKAYNHFFNTIEPLEDDEVFWSIVKHHAKKYERKWLGKDSRKVADSLLRSIIWPSSHEFPDDVCIEGDEEHAWYVMAQYEKRYGAEFDKLYDRMFNMPSVDRGDDAYGDLVELLILAGSRVVEGIYNDDVANMKQLERVLEHHPLGADFFLYGERYVRMALHDEVKRFYVSLARHKMEDVD